MKKYKFFLLLLVILSQVGCSDNGNSKMKSEYKYIFSNPSLGPINGKQELIVVIKDNKIVSAKEIKSGKEVSLNHIKGISSFKKAVSHQLDGLEVEYGKDGIPIFIKRVTPPKQLGGGFTLTIRRIKK